MFSVVLMIIWFILVICSLRIWADESNDSWCSLGVILITFYFIPKAYFTLENLMWAVPLYFIVGFLWSLVKYQSSVKDFIVRHPEYPRDRIERDCHPRYYYEEISLWVLAWPLSILLNAFGKLPSIIWRVIDNSVICWYKWILSACLSKMYPK